MKIFILIDVSYGEHWILFENELVSSIWHTVLLISCILGESLCCKYPCRFWTAFETCYKYLIRIYRNFVSFFYPRFELTYFFSIESSNYLVVLFEAAANFLLVEYLIFYLPWYQYFRALVFLVCLLQGRLYSMLLTI